MRSTPAFLISSSVRPAAIAKRGSPTDSRAAPAPARWRNWRREKRSDIRLSRISNITQGARHADLARATWTQPAPLFLTSVSVGQGKARQHPMGPESRAQRTVRLGELGPQSGQELTPAALGAWLDAVPHLYATRERQRRPRLHLPALVRGVVDGVM